MDDHFATLGQPRRPWLDADALKDAFHRQSATLHPDVPGTGDAARFAALNAAYTALREPVSRLRHLLELEAPATLSAGNAPPPELGDLFMELAGIRRRLDDFLARRNTATSPLSRALLAGEERGLAGEIGQVIGRLETAQAAALAELQALDAHWPEAHPDDLAALAVLYRRLSYLARWLAQTLEAQFALRS
jgi:curved DNA-binding protein CbpA